MRFRSIVFLYLFSFATRWPAIPKSLRAFKLPSACFKSRSVGNGRVLKSEKLFVLMRTDLAQTIASPLVIPQEIKTWNIKVNIQDIGLLFNNKLNFELDVAFFSPSLFWLSVYSRIGQPRLLIQLIEMSIGAWEPDPHRSRSYELRCKPRPLKKLKIESQI